ncbi:D-2-hydroxyacid dehydrogenase [Desulfocurvus sp.]|uniref:D-2-hydroxyacid dehydrogenase n=1 Tax=Desulfocurvus sp. TaxID=2871698 RepID=UPI0025BF0A13|nr:D-2-hydroxyacid dehydrogenase [Desulfocurvus sp.]MCK9238914.1 D-2-hydroxyacid dehydrogenase [Desulfocurvus sp.]
MIQQDPGPQAAARGPRMVVLDGHVLNPGDNPWDAVAALGRLTVHERTAPGEVRARAAGAQVVMTNKTPLRAADIEALPELRLVAVLATGYDVVDVGAAAARGVTVCNVPGYGTPAVAQFVFALILECCHRVGDHGASVRAGRWASGPDWCYWLTPQVELAGRTMGVVGYGDIGSRVAGLAHAFGMEVLVHTPRPKPAPGWGPFAFVGLEELFSQSDVVSLHCPLTAGNAGFVNDALLARMRPGAILVNTARGALVDEAALARALDRGALGAAALDVLGAEPPAAGHPLLERDNCILTPHMAWASQQARRRLMAQVAENIRAFLAGSPVNVVRG